jgi:hypothetical protein
MKLQRAVAAILLAISVFCPPATAANLARQDYILNCQGCHLADGGGAPGKVPRLKGFIGNFLKVPGGREYLIQVPGAAHSVLNDDRLAGVMNWVLENFSCEQLPVDYVPYSDAEVGVLRKDALLDPGARRGELLRDIETRLSVKESAGS